MKSWRFKLGVALIVVNVPLGWGAGAVGAALAAFTHRKAWLVAGVAAYVLSWGLLGLGVLLAGPDGVKAVKNWRERRGNK